MSIQAMTWVLDHSRSELAARLVLLAIANHADHRGRNAHPGQKQIAKEAHVSERTVRRCVDVLVELGELEVLPYCGRSGGNGRSHAYVMSGFVDSLEPKPDPDNLTGVDPAIPGHPRPHTRTSTTPNPDTGGRRTVLNRPEPSDDDDHAPTSTRPATSPSSSSDDPLWPVWLAFARLELAERATPPDHEANWLTGVARRARLERGDVLARLADTYPTADPAELARLLRDGHVPPAPARSWSCDCGATVEGLDAWQDHLAACDVGLVPADRIEVRS